jgi:hypothetical protein
MSKSKMVHPYIHNMERDEICQAGYDQLVKLLHKLPISVAAVDLMVTTPSLYRCMDDDLEVGKISVMLASHIIFMCETTVKLKDILNNRPAHNAYFQHKRHDVLDARKAMAKLPGAAKVPKTANGASA